MVGSKVELAKLAGTNFDLLQLLELKEEEFERSNKVRLELEKELSTSRSRFQAELKHVQGQLAWSKAELANSKQAFEKKDNESHRLSEQLHLAKLQHCQYEESVCNLQGEVLFLGLKLQNLEADSKKSHRQLKNQYYKSMDEWMSEKVSLMIQITHLEEQLQQMRPAVCDGRKPESTASRRCSDSLSFDMSHPEEAYAPIWFDSSSSHGSIQSLVELGEAFHAGDEELQHLRTKLKDAVTRESHLVLQLQNQTEKSAQLEAEIGHLKEELRAEKEKAREESEDMTQEMAELRYQFMEMLEVERDLRARTEQASVHRVEELEAQVDRARQQLVAALARRRETEQQSENLEVKIQHLNAALEIEHLQKKEYIETAQRDKESLQLRLLELQERFCQLEKEKKLLETRSSENLQICKPCSVQSALRTDAGEPLENAKLAELDNRLQALSCESDRNSWKVLDDKLSFLK
ncbi:hypothetical protein O6H91_19G011400 [Diphasiastrum complanatum]|uniref:Uncharacterized protein n=1 Tax=Diphasiastrum complanatum TaxID=34168 RepID=A0ACC2ASQ3_DIPCM|nr:hypothetical protein O6H91_19G011400 [Diphasiastrum complanatum]